MLSDFARSYIVASVPVLRERTVAITNTFYRSLFKTHPELKNKFNSGNQPIDLQQQSLAADVFTYAANIENANVLAPVVSSIVYKHACLGLSAKHYPNIGRHLLDAIKEALGHAATTPLLDAWAEVYSLLVDSLSKEKEKLHIDASISSEEMSDYEVMYIRKESEHVRSFVLVPADGKLLPYFHPGQYISVAVDLPDGTRHLRQYSLSDAPNKSYLRISVKREIEKDGFSSGKVSNWFHDNIKVNDIIQVSLPLGNFRPDTVSEAPLVLMSAGVGVTPMISALNEMAVERPEHNVMFAHAARGKSNHSHISDLDVAVEVMPNLKVIIFYETLRSSDRLNENIIQGEMEVSSLPKWPLKESNIYLCGPLGFMKKQYKQLTEAGVPREHIYIEAYGFDQLINQW